MQVTATATAAVAAPQPVIPAAYARYNSEGKSLGTEQPFNRQGSASAIKASLIAAGTAKRDVREKTREFCRGSAPWRSSWPELGSGASVRRASSPSTAA